VQEKYAGLRAAVPLMTLWGGISAIISCITGYLLSQSADYNASLVFSHQWLGISTAAFALVVYYFHRKASAEALLKWTTVGLFVLITLTGHLGGSLTHGEDYLTEMFVSGSDKAAPLAPIPKIQDALLYKDLVNPILETLCYGCHG